MNEERHDFAKGLLIGTLIGGLIGAVAALLYAPKGGAETREALAEKAKDIADTFKNECGKALDKSRKTYESLMRRLKEQEEDIIRRTDRIMKKMSD
ncbi:MAG TPA: YtxH domain-containing protein [Syntrophales bacterium]|jgi:gas vesicle protein|nr:YtxH domain-containing protein [Syntrophales bacterium]HRT61379.1 YtxH domain-containing protein [Syntrophales bacterium]